MAKKTIIAKVLDVEAQDGIIEFPQNRTLYVEQLTDKAPLKPNGVFEPETLEEVFGHYRPEKKNVEMLDQDGRSIKENFRFGALKDFDDKGLIEQSEFLKTQKMRIESYNQIEQQLLRNKLLRKAFEDEEARKNLITALQALLSELQK